jgi:uncharacterized protein
MAEAMPQEIAVWYVLPSLRKEIAKEILKTKDMTQKDTAKLLGVTESAISQYLKAKRADEMKFSKESQKMIKKTAGLIIKDSRNARKYIYKLSNALMGSKEVCKIHMMHDKSIGKGCNICFDK